MNDLVKDEGGFHETAQLRLVFEEEQKLVAKRIVEKLIESTMELEDDPKGGDPYDHPAA